MDGGSFPPVKLEQYAKRFITGQLLFKRYTEDEQSGCAAGGTLHVIASLLAGAETPADQLSAPKHSFQREQQQAKAQAAVIEPQHAISGDQNDRPRLWVYNRR